MSLSKISPIQKYLSNFEKKEFTDMWLKKETDVMLLMATDIIETVGIDNFVKNAILQDKITCSEDCAFRHEGFLLESERVQWYERNHSSIVGYAKLFTAHKKETMAGWAEWSKWNLPTLTAADRASPVHKISTKELGEIFLAGDFTHQYHKPIASAFAMTMISIMTDRFLDIVEYSINAHNALLNTDTKTKI